MTRIRPHSLGLALGSLLALWHVLWALLVFAGGAQWLLDTVFRLHMIAPPYVVTPFDFGTAATLVVVTGTIGYVGGLFIGFILKYCGLSQGARTSDVVEPAHPKIA